MATLEYSDLERMQTLSTGQAADLKLDTGTMRVWVSRCSLADGETQPVQVERLIDGSWVDVTTPARYTGRVCEFKDFYIDAGPYQGYKITAITRNRRD